MGFESAYAARRRLALVAESSEIVSGAVQESFTAVDAIDLSRADSLQFEGARDVTEHLDQLAQDIIATPGAGGALLVAFAAQARALALVMEAARRTQGAAGLPAEVMTAVQNALRAPMPMGLTLA